MVNKVLIAGHGLTTNGASRAQNSHREIRVARQRIH
jgi:hypothetical protein